MKMLMYMNISKVCVCVCVCVCTDFFIGICRSKLKVEFILDRSKHHDVKDGSYWFVYTGVGGTYEQIRDKDQEFKGVCVYVCVCVCVLIIL